ncbi:MAG: sugar nucleotide-binding protein [Planctomycetes bacterium]|nr:sugar nucleotide-binding protein [Planctomycetota bacterium]
MSEDGIDLLITGAGGFLGGRLRGLARARGLRVASSRDGLGRLDLETPGATGTLVRALRPRRIVHAAAIPDIAACAAAPDLAWRVNVEASRELARAAADLGSRLLFVSTDQVFDGRDAPYTEDAPARPLHHYGRSKLAAETALLELDADLLVVRLPLLLGPARGGRRSASDQVYDAAREGRRLGLFVDEYRSPLVVEAAAEALLDLLDRPARGLLHLGGPERLSRFEIGRLLLLGAGLDPDSTLDPGRLAGHPLEATRPADLGLDSARAEAWLDRVMPRITEAIPFH